MAGNQFPDWDEHQNASYQLRLFVAGNSPVSVRAINNLQKILEEHLKDRYELEIVDIHQQPEWVVTENITAVPLLIKKNPIPKRILVGDMSDTSRVLRGLNI
jgi:circadian clock protein KaiB